MHYLEYGIIVSFIRAVFAPNVFCVVDVQGVLGASFLHFLLESMSSEGYFCISFKKDH